MSKKVITREDKYLFFINNKLNINLKVKKTLVIDLDETLIHCIKNENIISDLVTREMVLFVSFCMATLSQLRLLMLLLKI